MGRRGQTEHYFPVLDGLRAISILWVLFKHLPIAPELLAGPLAFIQARGELGVEMFFAISGFLVTRSLEQCRENATVSVSALVPAKDFLIRRIARIWPPYYVSLFLIALIMVWTGEINSSTASSAPHILWSVPTFMANYTMPRFSGHAAGGAPLSRSLMVIWSLCFEEQFYLMLLVLFLLDVKNYWKGLLALGFTSIVWRIWATLMDPSVNYQDVHMMTHYRWDAIAWGCVAWIKRDPMGTWLARSRLRRVAIWILCGASITLFRLWDPITPFQAAVSFTFTAPLFTLVLLSLYSVDSPLRRVLEWGPFVSLGQMSYELYLTHLFVIMLITEGVEFHDPWRPIALSAFCLIVGWEFHRFFGKPSRLWILAYTQRQRKSDPLRII